MFWVFGLLTTLTNVGWVRRLEWSVWGNAIRSSPDSEVIVGFCLFRACKFACFCAQLHALNMLPLFFTIFTVSSSPTVPAFYPLSIVCNATMHDCGIPLSFIISANQCKSWKVWDIHKMQVPELSSPLASTSGLSRCISV